MSRSVKSSGLKFAASVVLGGMGCSTHAADSAAIVTGSFTQGTVKSTLQAAGYTNTSMNLGAWPLTTGGNFGISFNNPQYQVNTLIAFGNGGSIELQFNQPFTPVPGEKDLGIFTAQAINAGSGAFLNGDMDAAILVSQDGQNWFNLDGTQILNPTTYTGITFPLNAPTMSYNYTTDANATQAGENHLSATQLAALNIADDATPMPDDSLFNNTNSTNAQRAAILSDMSTADYTEEFGTSGGGNWFDVSGSGLSSIDYVMLNGDANDPSSGGVRLEDIFANAGVVPLVPEPASVSLLGISAIAALWPRRRLSRV